MKVPDTLYHATIPENLDSILKTGIRCNYDGVYFCSTPVDSAKFVYIRTMKLPIPVICINTDILDTNLFTEGMDHNAAFFGNPKVYIYQGQIPPEAILNFIEVDIEEN